MPSSALEEEEIQMGTDLKGQNICTPEIFDISDDDIFKAMKEIPGYLDITPWGL